MPDDRGNDPDLTLEIVQRLSRVETKVDVLCQDFKDFKDSYRTFKSEIFSKLDEVYARKNNPGNSLNRSTKAAIIVALISSVGLVIQKIIEIIPALL